MRSIVVAWFVPSLVAVTVGPLVPRQSASKSASAPPLARTALLAPADVTDARLEELVKAGYAEVAIVAAPTWSKATADASSAKPADGAARSSAASSDFDVQVDAAPGSARHALHAVLDPAFATAAQLVRAKSLKLAWWVEVARQPRLAELEPGLLAGLEGHDEWRRLFQDAPASSEDVVVKCSPWIPVTTEEGLALHSAWIVELAKRLPPADRWFVNDLQGGPSACGCGNAACRWTSNYSSKQTTTPADDGAAARLLVRLRGAVGAADVVPVWTTECEQSDAAKEGKCAGVACFDGACWVEMWKQLDLVADSNATLGLLLLTKSFGRGGGDDAAGASWIGPAVGALAAADARRAGSPIATNRLVAVLEAAGRKHDVVEQEVAAAQAAGVRSVLVAFAPIDQSYAPKVVPLPK